MDNVLEESERVESFLMNTFNMLMSSVSVWAGIVSIQQTQRGTLLTQLAAIYLPISLVTSIFGMNVPGVDKAPAWSCVVALIIILALTWGLIAIMRIIPSLDPGISAGRIEDIINSGKNGKTRKHEGSG